MSSIRSYLILTLLCFFLYLPGIAGVSLLDRDEPHFAQASRQMAETGDAWRIRFQDQPRHLKPPGIYWMQAAAVKLFSSPASVSAWPYRLPSVFGALFAVLLTFHLGRRIADSKTALLAAILLACSLLLIIEAHLALTDAVFLATIVAMQLALREIYCLRRQKQTAAWPWAFYFWTALAAGVFIKGVSPLISGLTIIALCVADRQIAWLKALRFSWGIPWFFLLTLAWVIPFSAASGHNFLWDMISGDALPKLVSNQQSHGMPAGFFTLIFTASFWPGSLFIIPTAIWAWRRRREDNIRFLLAWILPLWIFFECIRSKLPEYVLPVYPAIALLTALWIQSAEKISIKKWQKILIIVQQILWILTGAALIAACFYIGGYTRLFTPLMLAGMIFLLIIFYRPALRRWTAAALIAAICGAFPVWHFALPGLPSLKIGQQAAAWLEREAPNAVDDAHPLRVVDYQEPSLVFYLGAHRVKMISLFAAARRIAPQPMLSLLHGPDEILWSPPFCAIVSRESNWPSLLNVSSPDDVFSSEPILLLISQPHLLCLNQLSLQNGFAWRSLGGISGFQLNRTRDVSLAFVQISQKGK